MGDGGRTSDVGARRSDGEGSSFRASRMDAGGDFMPRDPNSVLAVVLEKRLLLNVLSLTELVREGELDRVLSGGGLVGLSAGVRVVSRDMPGSLILPALLAPASAASSSWFRRYAAESMPLSGVCLNHVGSFEPSDSAICARDISLLASDAGSGVMFALLSCESLVGLRARSGVPLGERAAFSCASHDSGLLPSPPLDLGRCCHDSVPERANCVAVCGGVDAPGDAVSGVSSVIFAVDSVVAGLSVGRGEAGVLSLDVLEKRFSGEILRDARSTISQKLRVSLNAPKTNINQKRSHPLSPLHASPATLQTENITSQLTHQPVSSPSPFVQVQSPLPI